MENVRVNGISLDTPLKCKAPKTVSRSRGASVALGGKGLETRGCIGFALPLLLHPASLAREGFVIQVYYRILVDSWGSFGKGSISG
eukprot:8224632-Pyramimonas_sp.AAC.1